jgi:hypothetical protein
MKKKAFLTSVAALAASMVIDASAALPESLAEQLNAKDGTVQEQLAPKAALSPFVLERPDASESLNVAEHYSHRSHASHASHASSRY